MSKALVINGADFSTNKVETITISDNIPCTGLTLSEETITFSALKETETLTATKTPANTTDSLSWASSDTNVATVADGVVTAVGIGTATITATCGNQTATCSVSLESVELSGDDFVTILHKANSGTDLANSKDYAGSYGTESGNYLKKILYLASAETPTGYKALSGNNELYVGKYPIMIPKGATYFEIEAPNTVSFTNINLTYLNSTEHPTYSIAEKGAKAVSDIINDSVSGNKKKITIPTNISGLDSFYFAATFSTEISEAPSGMKVTFT